MSDDPALFSTGAPVSADPRASVQTPIANWQRDLIRKALDARGLVAMEERQQAVEEAAGRGVESLRALTHEEALVVLNRLGRSSTDGGSAGSAWDAREGDTWIDRL